MCSHCRTFGHAGHVGFSGVAKMFSNERSRYLACLMHIFKQNKYFFYDEYGLKSM